MDLDNTSAANVESKKFMTQKTTLQYHPQDYVVSYFLKYPVDNKFTPSNSSAKRLGYITDGWWFILLDLFFFFPLFELISLDLKT